MKIYFYIVNIDENSRAIGNYLKKVGMFVTSNLASETQQKNTSEFQSLDKIDLLLVYGDKIDQQSSYLLAAALSQGKKVLCLLPQATKIDDSLLNLQHDKILGKKLKILFFSDQDWRLVLAGYFEALEQGQTREFFNIKYTLRVSSKINNYLNWKSKKTDTKKADWLRDKIQQIMEDDDKYQDFLRDRFKK